MWVLLALSSSALLGVYDLFKKSSLKRNAFLPVLFFATSTGAIIFLILVILSGFEIIQSDNIVFVPQATFKMHLK